MKEKILEAFKKLPYIIYLLYLGRNLSILSNGYSDENTGWYLITNTVICIILSLILIFFVKKYNIYIISLITGLSLFILKYSPYSDMNKIKNKRMIEIYISCMLILLVFMVIIYLRKRKKIKTLIFIAICFAVSYPITEFYNQLYAEPKKVTYTAGVSELKNKEEMVKAIFNLPLANMVSYAGNKEIPIIRAKKEWYKEARGYYVAIAEEMKENEAVLMVSMETVVNYETMDSLASEIGKYLKMTGEGKKKVKLYINTLKNREQDLGEYEIYNNEVKKIKTLENLKESDNIFEDMAIIFTESLKGW